MLLDVLRLTIYAFTILPFNVITYLCKIKQYRYLQADYQSGRTGHKYNELLKALNLKSNLYSFHLKSFIDYLCNLFLFYVNSRIQLIDRFSSDEELSYSFSKLLSYSYIIEILTSKQSDWFSRIINMLMYRVDMLQALSILYSDLLTRLEDTVIKLCPLNF